MYTDRKLVYSGLAALARNRRFWITIFAGLLGFLISFLEVQVLPGVILVFAGILYLLIAIAYGPWLGALAGAIAMTRTIFILGNVYSVVFAALESFCIGYLTRRKMAAPLAGVVFWVFLGLPVVALTIFFVMHLNTSAWANVYKRALNGFINVIAADLLLAVPLVSGFLFRDRPQHRSVPLRELISSSLLLVSMVPIVVVSIAHARSNTRLEESALRSQIQAVVETTNMEVDDYVRRHQDAVLSLARAVPAHQSVGPYLLQRLIVDTHSINTGFITMLVSDKNGNVIASSPPLRGSHRVSDRDYFLKSMQMAVPYVSKVFLGRGFGQDPIVAISAAYRGSDGTSLGIVEGSLDLRQFRRFETMHRNLPLTGVLIADQYGRVLYASPEYHYRPLEQALLTPEPNEMSGRSLLERSPTVREPGYLTGSVVSSLTGWHVLARQSLVPLQQTTEAYYLGTLLWLAGAGTLAYLLANVIARRITSPIEELVQSLQHFRVGEEWKPPLGSSYSIPRELLGIQDYLGALAARLAESYRSMRETLEEKESLNRELQSLASDLDCKVQERTAELQFATAHAQEANSAKSLFLASMSHEIRTPLNAVIGMTDLLATSNLPAEELSVADTIRTSAHGLLVLINDILDFTKIESGRLELEEVEFDLRDLVDGVVAMVAADAHQKNIEIACQIPREVPERLVGDPNRVQQIIMNLASNAVKFTVEGEVLIAVEWLGAVGEVHRIRVRVVDTGIGIAPDTQGTLFEPFTQADVSTTRQFGGTGLGLAVSRRLVELMGGTIAVQSEMAQGSTFWFELAFRASTNEAGQPAPAVEHPVLIVDDNGTARHALQVNLDALGISSEAFENGKAALDAIRSRPFSAVILDFNLPPVDGIACDDAIRFYPGLEELPLVLLRPHNERISPSQERWTTILKKPAPTRRLRDALLALVHRSHAVSDSAALAPVEHKPAAVQVKQIILLVEDNPVNQQVALKLLARLGYDADLATDGVMAIQAAENGRYDAILMDCQMPVMDGYEAAREIRRRAQGTSHSVIIALTANAFLEDRERCRHAGMDDYIAKPVSLDTLRATLHKWLKPQPG